MTALLKLITSYINIKTKSLLQFQRKADMNKKWPEELLNKDSFIIIATKQPLIELQVSPHHLMQAQSDISIVKLSRP